MLKFSDGNDNGISNGRGNDDLTKAITRFVFFKRTSS